MSAARPKLASSPKPAPSKPRDLGLLSQVLGFRFRRIQNHLSRRLAEMPGIETSRPGELSVLAMMQANPGLSQVELSGEVGLDKAMIVVIIDELERQGYARRERAAEDRRRNLLFITPQGETVLERWMAVARENERTVRETLSPAEFAVLSELLDRIYNQCFNNADE
jgi:DNA-binding MarR family transcriptional regulator